MNWIWIAAIVLAAVIVVGLIVKLRLKRKLEDIDGLNGTMTVDQNREEGNIIGKFGDEE